MSINITLELLKETINNCNEKTEHPEKGALTNIAVNFIHAGYHEVAEMLLKYVISEYPSYPLAYFNLAQIYRMNLRTCLEKAKENLEIEMADPLFYKNISDEEIIVLDKFNRNKMLENITKILEKFK